MFRTLSFIFILSALALAPENRIGPAEAKPSLPSLSTSCVATARHGNSLVGSSSSRTAFEVCLKQSNSQVVSAVHVLENADPKEKVREERIVCKTETVRIHLGPPKFGTRTYRETVCTGQETKIYVRNKPDRPPAASSRSTSPNQSRVENSTNQSARSDQTGAAIFQPESFKISPTEATIQVGTQLTLRSLARSHYVSAVILGEQVSVRFVPVQTNWSPGGLSVGPGATFLPELTLAFDKVGDYEVEVVVSFQPEFQIAGQSNWFTGDRAIQISATSRISVTDLPAPITAQQPKPSSAAQPPSNSANQSKPRLASKDCLANPKGRGCTR